MNKDKQICDRCYKECFNYDEIKSKSYKRIICNECKEIEKMLLLKGIISDLIDLKIKLPKKFVFYSNNEFQGIKDIYACGEHDGSDDQVFATEEESNAICDIMNKLEDLFFIVKEYFWRWVYEQRQTNSRLTAWIKTSIR